MINHKREVAMKILDLFCGAGGAAMGYHRAFPDAEIIGVDITPQPRYPFKFIQGDAIDVLGCCDPSRLALIHASPPCQRYSDLARRNGNADAWPDLLPLVRYALMATGAPYVIENVEGAPMNRPVVLCGTMFSGLRVLRHRLFEASFHIPTPAHPKHPLVFTHDRRKAHYGLLDQDAAFVQVTGGGNCTVKNKADAMGIGWMNGHELNEAIPPAYTEHIGKAFAKGNRP